MSRARTYEYVVWQDEGIWTAHSPAVPGAYGLGKTKAGAVQDLSEAIGTMLEYLRDIGEAPPKSKKVSSGSIKVAA